MGRGCRGEIARRQRVGWLFAVVVTAVIVPGCGGEELASRWRDRDVAIDGVIGVEGEVDREWAGARTALEDEDASVGLLNDSEYLYVSLVLRDPALQRQMVGMGFTVWFDSGGGKDRKFGIRFPLGLGQSGFPMAEEGPPALGRRGRGGDGEFRDHLQETLEAMTDLEILGPGKEDRRKMHVFDAGGVEVEMGTADGALVYELRVPLVSSDAHPYAIGVEPGGKIGVGLETTRIDMRAMREEMRNRGPGGMGGGRGMPGGGMPGGGMPGGGRGGMGGRRPQMPDPLELWAKVRLASPQGQVSDLPRSDVSVISIDL